jgi:nitric oxide reductase large subunit
MSVTQSPNTEEPNTQSPNDEMPTWIKILLVLGVSITLTIIVYLFFINYKKMPEKVSEYDSSGQRFYGYI